MARRVINHDRFPRQMLPRAIEDSPGRPVDPITSPLPGSMAAVIDVFVFGEKGAGKTQFITAAMRSLNLELSTDEQLSVAEYRDNNRLDELINATARVDTKETGIVSHYVCVGDFSRVLNTLKSRLSWVLAHSRARWLYWFALAILALLTIGAVVAVASSLMSGETRQDLLLQVAGLSVLLIGWVIYYFALHREATSVKDAKQFEVVFWDIPGGDIYSKHDVSKAHHLRRLISRVSEERAADPQTPHSVAFVIVVNPLHYAVHETLEVQTDGTGPAPRVVESWRKCEEPAFKPIWRWVQTMAESSTPRMPEILLVFNRSALLDHLKKHPASVENWPDLTVMNVPVHNDGTAADTSRAIVFRIVPKRLEECFDWHPPSHEHHRCRVMRYEAGIVRHPIRTVAGIELAVGARGPLPHGTYRPTTIDADEQVLIYRYTEQLIPFEDDIRGLFRDWFMTVVRKASQKAAYHLRSAGSSTQVAPNVSDNEREVSTIGNDGDEFPAAPPPTTPDGAPPSRLRAFRLPATPPIPDVAWEPPEVPNDSSREGDDGLPY